MLRLCVLLAILAAVSCADTKIQTVETLLKELGLSNEYQIQPKPANGALDPEVASTLATIGLDQDTALVQALTKASIDMTSLVLLDHDTMASEFPGVDLGARLKLIDHIQGKAKGKSYTQLDRAAIGELFSDMLLAHDQRRSEHGDIAQVVAQLVEKNNEKLLDRVGTMIDERLAEGAGHRLHPQQRALADTGADGAAAAAARSLNAEGATLWLEDNDSKIVFGASADASLGRSGAGVLATNGLRVGSVDDGMCAAAGDSGTMRWNADKASLQVCDGDKAKWNSAGASVLDAAEGEACSADIKGSLQWDNDAQPVAVPQHPIATKALRCTATAWILTVAESFAIFLTGS